MDFFNNHNKLFGAAFLLFIGLTAFVAVLPAINNEQNNAPLPGSAPLSEEAVRGKALYVSNGCVACHTQQVRNVDMDKVWGNRPGLAADYASNRRTDFWRNTATLMGTERTRPDLTSIGSRQPSLEWNLVHLYNPRIVIKQSIMPAYPWLFESKAEPAKEDVVVRVPDTFQKQGLTLVATQDALDLVAYLQSLKQTELPGSTVSPAFLYQKQEQKSEPTGEFTPSKTEISESGQMLYATHCQACHQENGEGLKGAFPPLKGSTVVLDKDPSLIVNIIMKGYDAREEYGTMPAVGANADLNPEQIAAIINHERSNWGNNAPRVSVQDVEQIVQKIKKMPVQ
ncbi:cbb3-type cytochrome c oxidase subunit II [Dyadobacter subterraneus]|uniref:Cytochrome c n=1 Tax=Dyadobacter subterraneus TaxID=2773304 RepID=A0ABR9W794_9BACT|nr:cbb3-type cytochrome c oxidase subunit II [Dyadobacter subterraneus]MBE9461320.1 cytochrome c [Dyadobacter subterraneus]